MSVINSEENQESINEESTVCVGDGTTCVECGKVFTHPFYFSTHISTHTNQKGFVVVGQCALCGLVFSNADIFAAHLKSSQTRMEKQVATEEENEASERYPEANSESISQKDPDFENQCSDVQSNITDRQDVKTNSPQAQSVEIKTEIKTEVKEEINSSNNDEPRLKRKRKAPQRFEADSGPQLAAVLTDADPEVEAYLLSLKQMGLTVDPAAFSSHRGGKRRRKASESRRSKGRNEFAWAGDSMDVSLDVLSQKKTSPKYEYLDSDDSFEDDIEVLPESGKLTRGQRLQQRQERLSQAKEQGGASSSKKPVQVKLEVKSESKDESGTNTSVASVEVVNKHNKANVPFTKLNTASPAAKSGQPIPGAVVKRENTAVAAPTLASNVYRAPPPGNKMIANPGSRNIVHRNLPQPNLSKLASVRAPGPHFVNKNSQYRAASMPSSSNLYQTHPAVTATNIGPRAPGFQQGKVRERKGDTIGFSGTTNVQKSNSLEDLKKNSRENVEQMLQSIGMMAVTSSAMVQGKFFSSQKVQSGEIAFPPVKSNDLLGFRQPYYPHRGFPNRPYGRAETLSSQRAFSHRGQTKFWPKPVNSRGQAGSSATLANSYKSPGGHQMVHPHNFDPNIVEFSYPQTVRRGRGVNMHGSRGQHLHSVRGSVKGRSSNVAVRGRARGVASTVQSSTVQSLEVNKGRASFTHKQTKPGQGSGDIIVIDDDEILADGAQKSSPGHRSTGKVAILDVDVNNEISEIKVIEDKSQELSPVVTYLETEDSSNKQKISNHDDESFQDVENNSEAELDSTKSSHKGEKRKGKNTLMGAAEVSEVSDENDPCTSKSVCASDNGHSQVKGDAEVTPEENIEDIAGWKVCLAENSDSNEDDPSSSPRTRKMSSNEDHDLSPQGSPDMTNASSQLNETILEGPKQDDSLHQNGSQDSDNVQVSRGSPDQVLNESVSAESEPVLVRQSGSEEQNETKCGSSSSMTCSDKQDMPNEGEDAALNHSVLASDCPNQFSACATLDAQSSPSNTTLIEEGHAADCGNMSSEVGNTSLPLTSTVTGEDLVENCTDGGDKYIQADLVLTTHTAAADSAAQCVKDEIMEEKQEQPVCPSRNSSSALSLPPDVDESTDLENVSSDCGKKSSTDDNLTKNETSCVSTKDLASTCSSSHVATVESSHTSAIASSEASSNEAETYSEQNVPENEAGSERKQTDAAGEGESQADTCRINSPPCNDIPTSDTVEPESETNQTHSADFLKDGNSLLDIFTEIEKTCKEMENTLDKEKENQTVPQSEEGEVNMVLSDAEGVVDEKEDMTEVVKVATGNNGVSGHEAGSIDGVKESRSGDQKHSDMTCENEMMECESLADVNKEIKDTGEIETKDDIEVKDVCRILPVTECSQEVRQTSEED